MEIQNENRTGTLMEARNFRMPSKDWTLRTSPSGFAYFTHPHGGAFEIAEGPLKGEQHFSSAWSVAAALASVGKKLPLSRDFLEAVRSDPDWAGGRLPKSGSVNYSCPGYAMVGHRGYYWTVSDTGTPECVIVGATGGPTAFAVRNGIGGFSVRPAKQSAS